MPPRHVYWTIIVDNQPTAFRAVDPEELLPTFNRLKQKHPSAEMRWFERGRLWASREEAREALRSEAASPRESRGKSWRPGGEHRDPREKYQIAKKAKWARLKERWRGKPSDRPAREGTPRPDDRDRRSSERPQGGGWKPNRPALGPRGDWKPREEGRPAGTGWKPKGPGSRPPGGGGWKPQGPGSRPSGTGWKPKGPGSRPGGGSGWRPKGPGNGPSGAGGWKPKDAGGRPGSGTGWKPKGPGSRPSGAGWKPKGPGTRSSSPSGWKPKGPGGRPSGGSAWRPKGPGRPPSGGRRPPSRDPRKRGGGGGGR